MNACRKSPLIQTQFVFDVASILSQNCMKRCIKFVHEGRLRDLHPVSNDFEKLTGEKAVTVEQFFAENKEMLFTQ